MTRNTAAMILPNPEQPNQIGENWLPFHDERLPRTFDLDYTPHAVGPSWPVGDRPPCERHLFDVIDTSRDIYDDEPDDGEGPYVDRPQREDFRAVMTCVNCGYIEKWEGVRTVKSAHVDPVPLVAGRGAAQLRAQHVKGDTSWTAARLDGFHVHTHTGERVGMIEWARGPRGRRYYAGTIVAPIDDEGHVLYERHEAPSVLGVLQKMARHYESALRG